MKYTTSAIGLLTRQYRSVLKKCFLINMGLFALGVMGANPASAAITVQPTIDYLNSKVSDFTATSKYDLTTTQGSNTHFLVLDNGSGTLTRYWYTPAEGLETDSAKVKAEKNNLLNYLTGTSLTTTGATADNYVFKQGTTYYIIDKSKSRPASTYTLTATDDTPEHWGIDIDGTIHDLALHEQGSGDTAVYYKWTGTGTGHKLTTVGASEEYDLVAKYQTAGMTPQTDTYNFDTINPTDSTSTAPTITGVGVVRDASGEISDTLYLNNASTGTIEHNTTSYYVSMYSYVFGGALSNNDNITSIAADFVGNSLTTTYKRSSSSGNLYSYTGGGALSNYATSGKSVSIGDITGDFINNRVTGYSTTTNTFNTVFGGAIANKGYSNTYKATIGNITGDFINNYVSVYHYAKGGAVSNEIGIISSITGDFINNFASITGSYDNNYAKGGAIYNGYTYLNNTYHPAQIGSITGDFINNFVSASGSTSYTGGGAIHNLNEINSITGDFIGNFASGSYITYGGAIDNGGTAFSGEASAAQISSITGNFINNFVSASQKVYGGAINNSGKIGSITGNFINNYALSTSTTTYKGAYGGAIYNNGTDRTSNIGSITGDFIGNFAKSNSTAANNSAGGGAIYNYESKAKIDSITGNFINNFASSSAGAYGGAIYNHYSAKIGSITGDFTNNYSSTTSTSISARGGAINNYDSTIDSITGKFTNNFASSSAGAFGGAINNKGTTGNITGEFTDNYAKTTSSTLKAYGGAIYNGLEYSGVPSYSTSRITLGNTTFTGNYVEDMDGKRPNSIYNVGIINIAEGATVTVNDGWQTYVHATDATKIGQLNMGTGSTLNMNIGNGKIQQDSLGILTKDGTINATVDVNLAQEEADTIATSSVTLTDGIKDVTLNGLRFLDADPTAVTEAKTVQILKTQEGGLELKLGTDLENGILQRGKKESRSSTFNGDAKWSDSFGSWKEATDVFGTVALATTDEATPNDSITVIVTDVQTTKSDEVIDDTLQTVNNNVDHDDKTFTADADGDKYTVTDNLGATVGTLSVNGVADGEDETVDLKGFSGFELGDDAVALNLNNVTITDTSEGKTSTNTTVATVTNSAAKINLNNATVDGGIINAGELNIAGTSAIAGALIGTGDDAVLNVNSDFELASAVTNHAVNVKDATLTVGAGSLGADVALTSTGGTIDLGNNAVSVKSASLDGTSTLALRVNSLTDHGSLTADTINIGDGAKLKATLAQNAGLGDVTLLTANVSHDGDFADDDISHVEDGVTVEDNNMYKFLKKEGEFGVFTIAQKATAEEIAEEAGAEPWAAEAAGAYVDGEKFAENTVSADVANKLADLAQNDANGMVDAIKSIAPTETAVVQAQSTEDAQRLFKTVDAYLRGERDPMGFASGDELDGVSVWGKAYIGESKISRRGTVAGSDADSKGFIIGLEKKLNKEVKVGAGVQYDNTDIDAYHRDIDVDSVQGFIYSEYKPSNWFVNGVLSYGGSKYDEKKYALGTHYGAKYDAHIASAAAMTGYQYGIFTPEAGLRYYHIKQSGYTDTAGQSVEGDKSDILRGVAGVRMAKDFGAFRPEAYLGITYDLASDKGNTTVNLANGSSYTVQGKRLDKLGYEASVGLAASLSDNITASINYLGAYRNNYREHSGMFNVKYNF